MKYLKSFNESFYENFKLIGKIESSYPNGQKTPNFYLVSPNKKLSGTPIIFDRDINKYSIPIGIEVKIIGNTKDGNNPCWNNPIYVSKIKNVSENKIFENQKFCDECGSKLNLKDRFCDECGKKQDMSNRPKSDDEKSIIVKLDDPKVDLKEKINLIISTYENDLIQHQDFDKKALDVIGEYGKKYNYDTLYKKAFKLSKKSLIVGTIEIYKSKSQDPEYRKTLDSLIDEFHDKDVDDYDTSSAMMKALLLDAARLGSQKERGKLWKDQYMSLVNSYKKDDKGDNSTKIMSNIIALNMMVVVSHKYPKHKSEFDKIFQEYLKDGSSSELLKKTYAKESEIKNKPKQIYFDSSGKEIKNN
jgi:hypothetical protein